MFRSLLKSACLAAALAPLFAGVAQAGDPGIATANLGDTSQTYGQVYNGVPVDGVYGGYNFTTSYPAIQASLYPCPRSDIPLEVGRTVITNPALAPHEMLYAHKYRALYPPYYYKNTCRLACIPFFPKPCLCGTEVCVKYKSHVSLFSGYYPPISRVSYSNVGWR